MKTFFTILGAIFVFPFAIVAAIMLLCLAVFLFHILAALGSFVIGVFLVLAIIAYVLDE